MKAIAIVLCVVSLVSAYEFLFDFAKPDWDRVYTEYEGNPEFKKGKSLSFISSQPLKIYLGQLFVGRLCNQV